MSITVTQFKEFKNLIPQTKEITFNEQTIQLKQYLTYEDKLQFINTLINTVFDEETGVNPATKELVYTYLIVKHYASNIKFPQTKDINDEKSDDIVTTYDIAKGSGLYDKVIANIPMREVELLNDLIDETIAEKYYEIKNKYNVGKSIAKMINKLNDLDVDKTLEELKNIDPKQLQFLSQAIGWNNGINPNKK